MTNQSRWLSSVSLILDTKKSRCLFYREITILFLVLIFTFVPIHSEAIANSTTTSSKLISITKRIIIGAAEVGINEAGSRIMGSAWPYMKAALKPLFDELGSRIPGFDKLFGSAPNGSKIAEQSVEKISADPRLQNLIIDGFANLQDGQREINNRLSEIQIALEQQKEQIADLARLNEKKLNKIITMLEEQKKSSQQINYTSGITMYDLEGGYTLTSTYPGIDPSIPGCSWNVGELGMIIRAQNAFVAGAQFSLPLGPDAFFVETYREYDPQFYYWLKSQGAKETCITLSDNLDVFLYGSLLKIPLGEGSDMNLAREVKVTPNGFLLMWKDDSGVTNYWEFRKD